MEKLQFGSLVEYPNGEIKQYFPCHEYQLNIINSKARFVLALGGKNGGKTVCGALMLLNEIIKNDGKGEYLVVFPSVGVGAIATIPCIKRIFANNPILKGEVKGQVGSQYYQTATGANIYLKSSGSILEGAKPCYCWIDEAGLLSKDEYNQVVGRADGLNARVIMTSTPYFEHDWLISEIIEKCDSGDPNYYYQCFPSWANPANPQEAIDEARKRLPPHEFTMFYEGKFTGRPGQVYPEFNQCIVNDEDFNPHGIAGYCAGLDFGGNDPNCFLVGLLDLKDVLWVFHEHYKPNEDVLSLFDVLNTFNKNLKNSTTYNLNFIACDHRPELISGLRRIGLPARRVKKGINSIATGINLVNARIRSGRLKILRRCENLIKEGGKYVYPMANGVAIGEKPLQTCSDHALDAARYLISHIDRKEILHGHI